MKCSRTFEKTIKAISLNPLLLLILTLSFIIVNGSTLLQAKTLASASANLHLTIIDGYASTSIGSDAIGSIDKDELQSGAYRDSLHNGYYELTYSTPWTWTKTNYTTSDYTLSCQQIQQLNTASTQSHKRAQLEAYVSDVSATASAANNVQSNRVQINIPSYQQLNQQPKVFITCPPDVEGEYRANLNFKIKIPQSLQQSSWNWTLIVTIHTN